MASKAKQQLVSDLVGEINSKALVGLVNFENLPAQQLQTMRATLKARGVRIVMARKKLIDLALKTAKRDGVADLATKMKGLPALLFSDGNPFELYATIQKNKSEAPAKAGQTAPRDIVVKAGGTNFAPGPIISELASVGIKTKVDNGKLAIIDDVTVAKEGDEISVKLAETLKRLDIKPMEIGLDLVAVYENGTVFDAKQLHIDEEEYKANFTQAAQWAINLAVDVGFLTTDTAPLVFAKAQREAYAVAIEAAYLCDDTKEELLAKAEAQAQSVKTTAGVETTTTTPNQETSESTEE